jgi:hypothetical protein
MRYPFAVLIALAGIFAACATISRPLQDLCATQMVGTGFTKAQATKRCRTAI